MITQLPNRASASLLAVLIGVCGYVGFLAKPANHPRPRSQDWVIAYHMSYDNNLDPCGPIMADDDHFDYYTCVKGDVLEELPQRLRPIAEQLASIPRQAINAATSLQPCYRFGDESNYDPFEWLSDTYARGGRSTDSLADFRDWIDNELIVANAIHPMSRHTLRRWCGLSLFVPSGHKLTAKYGKLPLYRETLLDEFFDADKASHGDQNYQR